MVMNLRALVILLGLLCSVCPKTHVYYVIPTSNLGDGNCTVNGNRTLTPCFSLRTLLYEQELLSGKRSVALLFLPGIHVIPDNHTLSFSLRQLEIRPWVEHLKPTIKCMAQAGLDFQVDRNVNIFSINFSGCTLKYSQSYSNILFDIANSVQIVRCGFENSKRSYAIIIRGALDVSLHRLETTFNISFCIFFANNGAIQAINPNIFTGLHDDNLYINLWVSDSVFQSNHRDGEDGGALHVGRVDLKVSRSKFMSNKAREGGAIYSGYILSLPTDANVHVGSLSLWFPRIQISGCRFVNNSAVVGGAISISRLFSPQNPSVLTIPGAHLVVESIFQDNYAHEFGGAVHTLDVTVHFSNTQFKHNSANSGGALHILGKLSLDFIIANCSFALNVARINGGGIHCETHKSCSKNYHLVVNEGHSTSNSAGHGSGGFAFLSGCETRICSHNISTCRALRGGAVYAVESNIEFHQQTELVSNSADFYGGALCLTDNSYITFGAGNHTLVTFKHNIVTSQDGVGGAIYVSGDNCELISYPHFQCFVISYDLSKRFIFLNNSASQGSMLYGGLLDRCFMDCDLKKPQCLGIESVKNISQYEDTPLAIASEPVRLCLCGHDYKPQCDLREMRFTRMRIEFVGIAVDQDGNPMAAVVRAGYNESSAKLDKGEVRRRVSSRCNELSYHVFTTAAMATLVLQLEGSCERSQFSSLVMHIGVIPCSRGFETKNDRCVCERRLSNFFNITECDIDTNSIKRKAPIWLRYDEQYLRVHRNCPLDYCQAASKDISISSPDEQCANRHAGVICGSCQGNYSVALGGSKCLRCNSRYTFIWLAVVFAAAGVALVAFLLACNMNISHGTLNGLIFYANVVSISGLTSLQNCSIHPILSVFVAWLNLDLGVETCFYPGMDTYQKTWLQYAFPLYIWLLVAAIIAATYYSSTAMRIFGRNNIAILATLFLLSYTKILKTIIASLDFTQVFRSITSNMSAPMVPYKVWTYDGNIEYLKGKHIALFTVALLLLAFLFLPYTLLLTFGHCIRSMPVRRMRVQRLTRSAAFISIMDAYHAPYNRKHRYWTGLMLLTRCVLFLAFASSHRDSDILANTYIITLVLIAVLTVKTCSTKVYRNVHMNTLELCSLLNLVILSATVYYLKGKSSSADIACKCTSASVSFGAIIFIGISFYHAYLRIRKMKCYELVKQNILAIYFRKCDREVPVHEEGRHSVKKMPTTSIIELREELLAGTSDDEGTLDIYM